MNSDSDPTQAVFFCAHSIQQVAYKHKHKTVVECMKYIYSSTLLF